MQSIRPSTVPPPSCFLVVFLRHRLKQGKTLYLLLSLITNPNFLDFFAIVLHDKHSTRQALTFYCIFIFRLAVITQHLGLIHGIPTGAECRQYRAGQQGMQCMLGKPKPVFAQRGSKFPGAQSLKQLISPSLLQHRGVQCSRDSSPCLLMQSHLGPVQGQDDQQKCKKLERQISALRYWKGELNTHLPQAKEQMHKQTWRSLLW